MIRRTLHIASRCADFMRKTPIIDNIPVCSRMDRTLPDSNTSSPLGDTGVVDGQRRTSQKVLLTCTWGTSLQNRH
jgi:hypothetical protein